MDIIYAEKYYEQVQKRFPFLSIKQIDKIVKYGLRSFFMVNHHGGDVLLKSNYYTAYVGKLYNKPELFWQYYKIKWAIKLRIKYARQHRKFNGKYYFTMSKDFYETNYLPQCNKTGRRRKKFHFDYLRIYKIFEESAIQGGDYIFELDYPTDIGFSKLMVDFTISSFRLVSKRDENNDFIPVSKEKK